jgi:cytochrome c oxidase cbb3-type subunit 3
MACRALIEIDRNGFRILTTTMLVNKVREVRDNLNFCAHCRRAGATILICTVPLLYSCKREQRQFSHPPSYPNGFQVTMSDLRPGATAPQPVIKNDAEDKAYDVSEGKRLYSQYNCAGCHFNGGGGIGPALMDEKWIYGDAPINIFATIVEGRPNGMPSFREKIPDQQVWQIVAYVRSLSGQLRKDISPGRSDDMNAHKSEQASEEKKPVKSGIPGSAKQ